MVHQFLVFALLRLLPQLWQRLQVRPDIIKLLKNLTFVPDPDLESSTQSPQPKDEKPNQPWDNSCTLVVLQSNPCKSAARSHDGFHKWTDEQISSSLSSPLFRFITWQNMSLLCLLSEVRGTCVNPIWWFPEKKYGKSCQFLFTFPKYRKGRLGTIFLGEISFGVVRRWPKWSKLP